MKPIDKRLFLKKFGLDANDENKLIHVRAWANRLAGWAFSVEGFHVITSFDGGSASWLTAKINKNDFPSFYDQSGKVIPPYPTGDNVTGYDSKTGDDIINISYIKYKDIDHVKIVKKRDYLSSTNWLTIVDRHGISFTYWSGLGAKLEDKMADFLELAKEIVK